MILGRGILRAAARPGSCRGRAAGSGRQGRCITAAWLALPLALTGPLLTQAAPRDGAGRPTWGARIAFVRVLPQGGPPQVYALRPGRRSTPAIIPLPAPAIASPRWSPDGRTLAFIGGRTAPDSSDVTMADALYVAGADGSRARRLTRGAGHIRGLAWSPDGARIVVVRAPPSGAGSSLWIVDVRTRGLRRLTSGFTDLEPSWSPDGRTIAFLRIDSRTLRSRIRTVRPNGAGMRTILPRFRGVTEPIWSPRGAMLLIEDARRLYRVRPDGHGRRLLTTLATDSQGAREDPLATWSPDGRAVVFNQFRPGTVGISDLWLVRADGTGLRQLTRSPGTDTAPTWGP